MQTIELKKETGDKIELSQLRRWFRAAIDKDKKWRDEAIEDYKFYSGEQWADADRRALAEQGRPVITVNRIKPMINLLSGYQRLNRFEPAFLPRTSNDLELCKVRQAMSKYVFDVSDYLTVESRVFLDVALCGRGWFEVCYDWDEETFNGDAKVRRESPFNIYVDPESRESDLSDAEYVFRARWFAKGKLKQVYPEFADVIDRTVEEFDKDEKTEYLATEALWYQRETKKVRLLECWYREYVKKECVLLATGDIIEVKDLKAEQASQIIKTVEKNTQVIKVAVFIGDVLLEQMDSPYEHKQFPFVMMAGYYTGEARDIQAGIVRDLKDLQREINKRRSQKMHILNTQANSGWLYEEESLSAKQKSDFKRFGATPGAMLEYRAGRQAPGRIDPPNMPSGIIQDEQANSQDIREISGINEAMMGSDVAAASGKAMEFKQKQAVTHIAALFDNLRIAKKQVLNLLWGSPSRKGIIPQYYTEEKTFRIVGDDGEMQFMTVNQAQPVVDPVHGTIQQTLNDLSVGDFDIVVSDTPAAATQRVAQFYAMLEAVKMGIQIPPDMIVEASDWPQKQEIKKRIVEAQQQAQEMAQQQAQAQAQQKQPDKISQSISFKDLPPAGQIQLAAKAGIQLGPQAQGTNQNVQMEQPQQGNGPSLQDIYKGVQSGQITPQMIQQAVQQGLISPQIAQQLISQSPAPPGSAESARYKMTPEQVISSYQAGL